MAKVETSNLTSYDFVKFAAIVVMIVDHIGYYFYPEDMWFRAIGRLSAPIWLFLIGYARSRDLMPLVIGTVLLLLSSIVVGQPLLPLPILATMLLARLALDPLMAQMLRQKDKTAALLIAAVLLAFLSIFTAPLVDYGTGGMLFVIAGYLCRNRAALPYKNYERILYMLISVILYSMIAFFLFFTKFDFAQQLLVGAGLTFIVVALDRFRPLEYPALKRKMPKPVTAIIQFGGRHSLIIFVGHLILFKVAALYLGMEGYDLFAVKLS